jgi:hypothetical protein
MPDVLVIGARGALGRCLVRTFEDRGWRVHPGARRPNGPGSARLVDLDRPETLPEAISGMDLVINPVPHPGLAPERTVLRDGGLLIDVSARPAVSARRLHDEEKDSRGAVVMNAGRTPGISNLVVADLLSEHPNADAVEIVFSFSAAGLSGRAGGEFVHRHLTSAPHHQTTLIPFPAPIGPRRCLAFAESERGWLGELADGRAVRTYARFSPRGLHWALMAVNRLHLSLALPRAAFVAGNDAPIEPTNEPLTEWIAVLRRGKRLAAATVEGKGGYLVTAVATAVLAEALLEPGRRTDPARRGCFEPHELWTLQQVKAGLRDGGLEVVRQPLTSARPS